MTNNTDIKFHFISVLKNSAFSVVLLFSMLVLASLLIYNEVLPENIIGILPQILLFLITFFFATRTIKEKTSKKLLYTFLTGALILIVLFIAGMLLISKPINIHTIINTVLMVTLACFFAGMFSVRTKNKKRKK